MKTSKTCSLLPRADCETCQYIALHPMNTRTGLGMLNTIINAFGWGWMPNLRQLEDSARAARKRK